MQCPLCGGPLRIEPAEQFVCERGHRLPGKELAEAVATRVTMAFWLAIEALESEAEALQVIADGQGGNDQIARRAVEDARVLREMATAHLASLGGRGDVD